MLSVCSRVIVNLTLMLDLYMMKDNIIQQGCYTHTGLVLPLYIGQVSTLLRLYNKHPQIPSDSQYQICISYSQICKSATVQLILAGLSWVQLGSKL